MELKKYSTESINECIDYALASGDDTDTRQANATLALAMIEFNRYLKEKEGNY